ncbi:hypothetical protein GOBAR_AA20009 [Gossypium barbadense]|uniref:Uncharacterized protein n=1 Tax=Gossypium barbadense TaxID=3634 RepID=A0A2P5XBD2_GOSBA|nr:hypothetical protein GOBAR_AA20009 [Gossypium barbadense]
MVPAENLPKQHHLPHGGGGGFYGYCGSSYTESFGLMSRVYGYDFHAEAYVGSDLAANRMAEDESTTNSLNEAGSNSKDNNQELELERDEGWLQLGLGGQPTRYDANKHYQGDPTARRGGMIELDLLPGGMSQQARPLLAPIFHMPDFRAPPPPPSPLMHSFSSSLFFHHQQGSSSPSSDVRIIDPPRRPHSGIWFVLQASQNQAKEPFLPQIPKSYLRIKDGKMTVRLLMKYLVNKLRLDSESEVGSAV